MRFFFLQEAPPSLEGPWQPPKELSQHLRALRFQEKEEFLLLLPQGGAVGVANLKSGCCCARGTVDVVCFEIGKVRWASSLLPPHLEV